MHLFKLTASVMFVMFIPVFLVLTNVRWVIGTPAIYNYGFNKYDVVIGTGIERGELLRAARQIRDYFHNSALDIEVRVVQRGVLQTIYGSREVAHMRDVKRLIRRVYRVHELAAGYLLFFVAVGFAIGRRGFFGSLASLVKISGSLTIGLVLVVGLGSLVGFDRLFLAFHHVSFSNDYWQLDPSRHNLIAMFPQGFFSDATLWIAGATIAEVIVIVPVVLLLARKKQRSPQMEIHNANIVPGSRDST